jgi:hypothetical protein
MLSAMTAGDSLACSALFVLISILFALWAMKNR